MKTHKDLDAWRISVNLVTDIYQMTSDLTNQIRRSSISTPSNIAEGAARKSKNEFIHFLYIALGSQQELDIQLLITRNLKFISQEIYRSSNANSGNRKTIEWTNKIFKINDK